MWSHIPILLVSLALLACAAAANAGEPVEARPPVPAPTVIDLPPLDVPGEVHTPRVTHIVARGQVADSVQLELRRSFVPDLIDASPR